MIIFIIDDNHRVFVYEEEIWTIKGQYETALEDNKEATWSYENGQDIICFLVVSIFYSISILWFHSNTIMRMAMILCVFWL